MSRVARCTSREGAPAGRGRGRRWLLVLAMAGLMGCRAESERAPESGSAESPPPPATVPAGPSLTIEPLVSINEVMVALIDHAAHHLWDLGREGAAPKTDRDWMEAEHHAIQLAAGASWIATGGAGEADSGWVRQSTWTGHARKLNDGAFDALLAARARDLPEVLAAGDRVIEACEACHREFKPELPTEGVVHPHIYEPRVQ
jgi:hypothetical protein